MKKLMMMVAAAALLIGSAAAQNLDTVRFHLPYPAVVSGKELPAGDYTVQVLSNAGAVPILSIASMTGERVISAAKYLNSENLADESRVVLVRNGDHYRLEKVWIGDIGYSLIPNR